jgi:hypothetical protein
MRGDGLRAHHVGGLNLLAANGQVIATSETYESKESALNGIKSVQTNAPGATVVDETK